MPQTFHGDVMRRLIALSAALFIAGNIISIAAPAHAMDPEAVFNRYKAMWQQFGLSASFGSMEPGGNTGVVFRDVTLQHPRKAALKIDRLAFTGVVPEGSDGFSAQSLEIGQLTFDVTDKKGRVVAMRMDGGTATGLYLPPTGSTGPMVSKTVPYTMALGQLTATVDRKPAFTISGISGTMGYDASGEAVGITTAIGKIDISTDQASPKLRGQLAAAGLTELSLSMSVRGSWNMETGRMALDEYRLAAKDAGSMTFSLGLEGYTPQLSAQMQKLAKRREALEPNDADGKKALASEMMAALVQLQLSSAKLEFEDGALTRQLLTTQAEAMGITPDELAASLPMMLGSYLVMAGNQQFSEQAVTALGTFLANPGRLTLSLGPPQPVAITGLVEAILNAPETIVPLLGANVTANQ
jgi:hypothetical protein